MILDYFKPKQVSYVEYFPTRGEKIYILIQSSLCGPALISLCGNSNQRMWADDFRAPIT